jgi:uncharacterized membrane protein
MNLLIKYFLRGLAIVVPIGVTVWVVYQTFTRIDRLIQAPVPGIGFAVTIVSIIAVGMLASNIVGRTFFGFTERLFARAPFVKIVYTSIKDLVDAFVGDKKRFKHPVLVPFTADGSVRVVGFVTREDLEMLTIPGFAAVYCPHSYNFSGQLMIVARERLLPLPTDGGQLMPFVVSGGVSGM